ncbi:hypothetical protein VIGAN_06105200 [Vigna angularis var. angularis]|uniref:Uncharacterized protein n=1 Tax=Vigna angularis var. angularis TaxID=157739 RepID=A0A0S3SAN1_PHAAN|nr:hypothetical protein VIGAN_06105200 [Vigna angularis var. angularis]
MFHKIPTQQGNVNFSNNFHSIQNRRHCFDLFQTKFYRFISVSSNNCLPGVLIQVETVDNKIRVYIRNWTYQNMHFTNNFIG